MPRPQPTNEETKTLPHGGILGERERICSPDAGPGKRHFIKCLCQNVARGDQVKDAAAEEPAVGRSVTKTCNQAPVYIRGSEPLA
jgi:hypothetical protein